MVDNYKLNDLIDIIDRPGMLAITDLIELELIANDKRINMLERGALRGDEGDFQKKKHELHELDGISKGLRRVLAILSRDYLDSKLEEARRNNNGRD